MDFVYPSSWLSECCKIPVTKNHTQNTPRCPEKKCKITLHTRSAPSSALPLPPTPTSIKSRYQIILIPTLMKDMNNIIK